MIFTLVKLANELKLVVNVHQSVIHYIFSSFTKTSNFDWQTDFGRFPRQQFDGRRSTQTHMSDLQQGVRTKAFLGKSHAKPYWGEAISVSHLPAAVQYQRKSSGSYGDALEVDKSNENEFYSHLFVYDLCFSE